MVTKLFEEFGIEGDPPCNVLSLLIKLSRNMTKIKEHKRNKKTSVFTFRIYVASNINSNSNDRSGEKTLDM